MCVCTRVCTHTSTSKDMFARWGILKLELGLCSGSGVSWDGWSSGRVLGNGLHPYKSPQR